MTVDFKVRNEGSIFLLQPITEAANDWVNDHIPKDAQFLGTAVAVEHRYIANIVQGIINDGLGVE